MVWGDAHLFGSNDDDDDDDDDDMSGTHWKLNGQQ
jgi:hypothetical protein